MAGLHAHVVGHLIKRGAELVAKPMDSSFSDEHIKALEKAASAYEESGVKELMPKDFLLIAITFLIFFVLFFSVRYTIGEVIASLVMIEQPRTAVVVAEPQPPQYTEYSDAGNASDSKNAYRSTQPVVLPHDEEVVVVQEIPVTSSIRATIHHLISIGGFRARFRGLSVAIVYGIGQSIGAEAFSTLFSILPIWQPLAMILGSIASTLCLVRIHMTWTHIMISEPSPLSWLRRVPRGRSYFKALLTPAFMFAIAQHMTVALPMMVFMSFGKATSMFDPEHSAGDAKHEVARLLATLGTSVFVALAIYLPASVTLTRVEASLLPDDVETIVNFDRTLGGAAANLVGFGKINFAALYDAAWRSFDKASRTRLLKFYIKYNLILIMLCMLFGGIIVAQVFTLGVDRLAVFAESAGAQLQLMAIEKAAQN